MSREGHMIAAGIERQVFEDLDNPDMVLKRDRNEDLAPRKARARFYLGKLLHLLLPEHVPQIHESTTIPPRMKMERKTLDAEHVSMSKRGLPAELRPKDYVYPGFSEEERFRESRKADERV